MISKGDRQQRCSQWPCVWSSRLFRLLTTETHKCPIWCQYSFTVSIIVLLACAATPKTHTSSSALLTNICKGRCIFSRHVQQHKGRKAPAIFTVLKHIRQRNQSKKLRLLKLWRRASNPVQNQLYLKLFSSSDPKSCASTFLLSIRKRLCFSWSQFRKMCCKGRFVYTSWSSLTNHYSYSDVIKLDGKKLWSKILIVYFWC